MESQKAIPYEAGQNPPASADRASPPAISIRGLTKRYGPLTALNDLNLDINRGEIFGFLGLNGAGKTTAIRLLLDLLRPTSGQAFIFGYDCWSESLDARARIGYLPGELGLYLDLTGLETLDFLAGLNRQPVDKRHRQELCDRLELPRSDLRRRLREYSTGMKRKLGIIQAFQANPPLLILDEPTEGLDPLMQESFYGLLADVKRGGRDRFHVVPCAVRSRAGLRPDRALAQRRNGPPLQRAGKPPPGAAARARSFQRGRERRSGTPAGPPTDGKDSPAVAADASPARSARCSPGSRGCPWQDMEIEEARLEDVVLRYYREEAS